MEHKNSRIKNMVNEKHKEKSYPEYIQESSQPDATLLGN